MFSVEKYYGEDRNGYYAAIEAVRLRGTIVDWVDGKGYGWVNTGLPFLHQRGADIVVVESFHGGNRKAGRSLTRVNQHGQARHTDKPPR